MSTATIARVRSVIASSTALTSRLSVRGSTSAKTGTAPSTMKQFAVATKEIGDVITSSPRPRPAMWQSRWRPAVPLETAAANGAPTRSANSSSKRSIIGPSESRPERSTSRTSSSSRSSRYGRERGIKEVLSSLGARREGVLQPVLVALGTPAHRVQVSLLQLERHGPDADLDVVHAPDGRHLGGGAAHEDLVGDHEVGPDEVPLLDDVAEVAGDVDHRLARDAGKDRHGDRRRRDLAVADDEDVLAGAVRHVALGGEQDRLVVAGAVRLGDGEHRVEVDAGRLGDVRYDVRADPLPGGDLGADPVAEAILAEVRAPRPAHDHALHGVLAGGDAELAVAEEADRAQVALGKAVRLDELEAGRAEVLERERQRHREQARRVLQAPEVVRQAEDRRALVGLVAADALEDARPVVQAVGSDMDRRVGPVDELAVHPDLLGLLH